MSESVSVGLGQGEIQTELFWVMAFSIVAEDEDLK